ncbi:hypothetical protein [Brevundimonas sp. Root1279]|uniref:hypothetical protein n=1 Tax=Brevundimonas sp. Root1279 TaxID=1736443 RepID=UPI0006FE92A7|nr:hypothetical protein [Brevundimonas sp. Root1279]KQW86599.1 hypothetical protein ASC65_01510 [Brevundimonas sp. Root1279]
MTGKGTAQTPSPLPGAGASFVPATLAPGASLTPEDLALAGERLFGRWGWQTRLAEALEVDGSTVRRWVSGAVAVPNPAKVAIRLMLTAREAGELLAGREPTPAPLPSRPRSTSLTRERTGRKDD